MAEVKIGDVIYDSRFGKEIEITKQVQVEAYSFVAPELIKKIEKKEEKITMSEKTKNELVEAKPIKDVGQKAVMNMMDQISSFAAMEQTELSPMEKSFAMAAILYISKQLQNKEIGWKDIDIVGCAVPQQIKAYARLGLSFDNGEIYLDVRNNKGNKDGLKDLNIKKQYQGIEKELLKFSSKKILRFKTDVVVKGEELIIEEDFTTGLDRIVGHKKIENRNPNEWKDIISAYKIAFIEEDDGSIVQYYAIADRDRLERAYNASPSNDKSVWKKDTRLMCLKTASWVLYNNVLRPFVNIPIEVQADWALTNTEMDFDEEPETPKVETKAKDFDKNKVVADVKPGFVAPKKEEVEEKVVVKNQSLFENKEQEDDEEPPF